MIKNYFLAAKKLRFLIVFAAIPLCTKAQTNYVNQISLDNLSAFKDAPANWAVAGMVTGDFSKPNTIKQKSGTGILVNTITKKKNEDLFTVMEHGDIDLDLDFMMPKRSNSGIYLQGRYEIQLMDSWGKDAVTDQDLGSVYQRWDETRPAGHFGYNGVAPRLNVSKAPGLWQNIKISFLAPKFDGAGKKIANARIVKVVLNGVTILENIDLAGPTRSPAFENEAPMGPLRFQGDHGAVALKNIRYNTSVIAKATDGSKPNWSNVDKPIFVTVGDEPVVLRSFVMFNNKSVTHAVNVGYKHNVSFAYDLDNGAVFQIWRGGFIDASPMWVSRGDGHSKAIGSIVPLNNAPSLAVLSSENEAWPDTIVNHEAFRIKGYELDEQGYPTFKYIFNNMNVDDKMIPDGDGKVLTRQLSLTNTGQNKLYYRIASGKDIMALDDGMYSINNFEYYLQLPKESKVKPILRNSAAGKELLLPVNTGDKPETIQYSLIW